jgi:DNA-binding MarR family transcriptional regulator
MKTTESLSFGVGFMARAFDRELRAAFHPHGVLPGHFPVLLVLYESDGITQAELARAVGVEQPTMAGTLRRMEAVGLVRREPDRGDARRAGVFLTDRARELEEPLTAAARNVNRRAVRGLSAEERALLYAVLERAISNLAGRGRSGLQGKINT